VETKPVWASKINIVQGLMALIAVLSDPALADLNIIPPAWLPKIMWSCNALTFVLRTFFSGTRLTFGSQGGSNGR
jgi:hypothetical protein